MYLLSTNGPYEIPNHCPTIPLSAPFLFFRDVKGPDQVMDIGISRPDPPFMLLFMYVLGTASLGSYCLSSLALPLFFLSYFCCVFEVVSSRDAVMHFISPPGLCEFVFWYCFFFLVFLWRKDLHQIYRPKKSTKGNKWKNIKT